MPKQTSNNLPGQIKNQAAETTSKKTIAEIESERRKVWVERERVMVLKDSEEILQRQIGRFNTD